jgi:hypothetical protein
MNPWIFLVSSNKSSEWLLFNAKSAMFSAIWWREQVNFQWEDDEVCFVLEQHAYLNVMVLYYWSNRLRIDMLPHSDTLSWIWANQSLLFLLNTACLTEKQQIPFFFGVVWSDSSSNLRSTAVGANTLTMHQRCVYE